MEKRTRLKNSIADIFSKVLKELVYPEERTVKTAHKKSEYYQNPFGGFLP